MQKVKEKKNKYVKIFNICSFKIFKTSFINKRWKSVI